jgi:hypothetical protein
VIVPLTPPKSAKSAEVGVAAIVQLAGVWKSPPAAGPIQTAVAAWSVPLIAQAAKAVAAALESSLRLVRLTNRAKKSRFIRFPLPKAADNKACDANPFETKHRRSFHSDWRRCDTGHTKSAVYRLQQSDSHFSENYSFSPFPSQTVHDVILS